VSLLVALTVGILTWVTYLNTRDAVLKLTANRVDDLLNGLSARVENHVLRAVPSVELAHSVAANAVDSVSPDVLARHFTFVLQANPGFSWASYSDQNGRFTGAYRTNSGRLRVSLSTIRNGRGELREYSVDPTGKWTLVEHDTNYDYDPRLDKFYAAAISARERVWVGPYVLYDEGLPGITCARPLFSADGSPLGVFTVDFDLPVLSRFVADLRFGESGRVFILTRDGHVVAHPLLRLTPMPRQGGKGPLPTTSEVNDPLLQAFVKSRVTGAAPDGQSIVDLDGTEYIAARKEIKLDNGLTWILGAVAPADDFLWVVKRNRDLAILMVAAGVISGVILAMLLARRITSPLTMIAAEMQDVGTFQLEDRPPLNTRFREVAMMDRSLNNMKRGLRSFAYYVPTGLVRSVLESGHEVTLAGETREMTVYFSDIESFTTKAEALTPEELVRNLSDYLDEMTRIVTACDGTIDKFIGDAIMAFWGAPADVPNHAARACETALRSQRRLAELRASATEPWLADLHARIGIATGQMLVGNIGSRDRYNYTVMGDTVNLASRLESLGKQYGTESLISEDTFEAAKAHVIARPVDLVRVKGRLHGVWVYELLCLASEEDPTARALARICTEAFVAYRSRDFQGAAQLFEQALTLRPGDLAVAVLRDRSLHFTQSSPPADWNGAYVAVAK